MLNSIRVFLTLIVVSTMALADVLITEIADPNNNASARFVANVDLPTPPFALDIAIVNFVPGIGFFLKVFGSVFVFIK